MPCGLSKGHLKRDFSDIYLTTYSESLISEIQNLWGSSFNFKYLKFNVDFKNGAKNWEKVFFLLDNSIWIGIVKLSPLRTGYVSSTGDVLTTSPKIWHGKNRAFFQLNCLGSDQWIWWTCCDADFDSGSARLPCFFSKGPLKREILYIYMITFSESVIPEIQNLWGSSFLSKCSKFDLYLKNAVKNWQKVLCFWDNCIWIGIVKLSLLKTGFFSSDASVLTSSPKIWHCKNRDFFQLNWLGSDRLIWSKCCHTDLNIGSAPLPCWLSKGPLKQEFLDIYRTTFSEYVISELQNLLLPSFFRNI